MTAKTPQTPEIIQHMLKTLERPSKDLTAWELGFLADIADQFERYGNLTERQFEKLEAIYAEKTD